MLRLVKAPFALVVIFLAGCGQSKPVAPATVQDPAPVIKSEPGIDVPKVKVEPTSTAALVATAADGTAEATFQQTLIAFQDGRLDTAFEFLPPSYQADVEKIVQTFAGTMDAELWSHAFQVLNKVANLLKTKKELILNLEGVKRFPQIDAIKPYWDAIAARIKDIATSEIADLNKLKQSDVRKLLVSGNQLLAGLPLPKFGDVQVTTVKSDSNTAILSYKESQNPESKEVEFVRVEGKWLPKSIATGWAAGIEDARRRIEGLPGQLAQWKPEAMKQFDNVNGMLDQIQAAKTKEEFTSAVMPLMFTMAFGAQLAQQAMRDAETNPRTGNAVNCLINRELTDVELTALKDAVTTSLGAAGSKPDYELIPNDGKTRCRFTPVADVDALVLTVKKHFSGSSVRLDAETKTIYVDLK